MKILLNTKKFLNQIIINLNKFNFPINNLKSNQYEDLILNNLLQNNLNIKIPNNNNNNNNIKEEIKLKNINKPPLPNNYKNNQNFINVPTNTNSSINNEQLITIEENNINSFNNNNNDIDNNDFINSRNFFNSKSTDNNNNNNNFHSFSKNNLKLFQTTPNYLEPINRLRKKLNILEEQYKSNKKNKQLIINQ